MASILFLFFHLLMLHLSSTRSLPMLDEKPLRMPYLAGVAADHGHHAGYYRHSRAARMFYMFFESRTDKKAPVVIWLHGGPGCSSEIAVFLDNGPFHISKNLSLTWNDYGWDKASNLLYVDQPTGTGFSFTTNSSDLCHNERCVSRNLYGFLQAFFSHHPQFIKNDFYITGESYAGHHIPALASRVHQGNIQKKGIHINLKGFAIGNGLTNSGVQYKSYLDFAVGMGLINKTDYKRINSQYMPTCEAALKICDLTGGKWPCEHAYLACNEIFSNIMALNLDMNMMDIRTRCPGSVCNDFSHLMAYLNNKTVQNALGVGEIKFVPCNTSVYSKMVRDYMQNLEVYIPGLLEDGIKVLIYAGEYDFICNWLGNSNWVHSMKWYGQKAFGNSTIVPFKVDGAIAGELKSERPLSFLKVHNAGHMVPMDQPKAALQMLEKWMQGNLASA